MLGQGAMASAFQKVRATNNAMVGLFERFDVLAMPAFGEQHTLPKPAAAANVFALHLRKSVLQHTDGLCWRNSLHIKQHTPDQTPPLLPSLACAGFVRNSVSCNTRLASTQRFAHDDTMVGFARS